MNKYKVCAYETMKTVYLVEAPSPEDAVDLVSGGDYERILAEGSDGIEFDFPVLVEENNEL